MSLTKLIQLPQVSAEILRIANIPKLSLPPIKVPRMTNDPPKMGTAVDYGIRFYLAAKYGATQVGDLIAEMTLHMPILGSQKKQIQDIIASAIDCLESAKSFNITYAYHCWQLANLDVIYRTGTMPKTIPDMMTSTEAHEFMALMKLAAESWPQPESYCLLNPTFGWATNLVNGADADVVQDDAIVDIKTIARPITENITNLFKQLIGYAVLDQIDGVDGKPHGRTITHVGLYAARHGHYQTWLLEDIISKDDLRGLEEFFRETVMNIAYPKTGEKNAPKNKEASGVQS